MHPVQNNLRELILDTAEEKKIPFSVWLLQELPEQTRMHLRTAMVVWLRL
jgi:hypothetical protein